MDPDSLGASTTNAPRKVRFAPKAPPKKELKPVLPKVEKNENDIDDAQAEQLLRKLNESSLRGKPKVERKTAPSQVAFGNASSSASLRSYGGSRPINLNQGSASNGGAENRVEKEYKEPWDYYTYYPVTLPLRRPYSGNPEILDKEDFDEDAERSTYDEYATNSAENLGLMEDNPEGNMFFLQLPANMPAIEQSTNGEVNGTEDKSNLPKGAGTSQKPCKVEELPAGFMGKMLVYKSGAIKMKLGDTLYDVSGSKLIPTVSAGLSSLFAQDVLAVNTEDGHCCNLGELNKRAVLMPDVDCILDSISDL